MAALRGSLLGLGLLLPLLACRRGWAAASEAFDSALGSTASCHRACQLTYPLHTYPKEEELYACQRGCRLFSICQFVDDGIDLNRTKVECNSACTEAYSQSDEQYACHLGCQNQQPFAELRQEQSKPEVQYIPQLDQDTTDLKESLLSKTSSDVQPGGSQTKRGFFEEEESNGFLKCLSINSGWILTTTLVLSVLVLLWICCATVATAAQQYVPSEKLSIYGDLEYMNEQKLTRYPASALVVVRCETEEHEEAGPLPTKVNLAYSAI